jgi:dTDP-4-amino-4,6-dideoxygalactose transaminase
MLSRHIPLVDLRKQYQPLKGLIMTEIAQVLEGMELFLGKNVEAFEREFSAYCGCSFGVGVGSGTEALHLALRACGVGQGDEVITVANTFIATVEAIAMVGATPVFVDIDPLTYTIDVDQIEEKLSSKTRAILPVHLYGHPADMDPILDLAKRHGLRVIEDACQAHGATYKGRRAGSLGDAGCFSFYFSKNLGAYGEAGMVTTNDEGLWEQVRLLRDHGSRSKYSHELLGTNGRLDEIQAAILRVKLGKLEEWNALRRQHARAYAKALQDSVVSLPFEHPQVQHAYYVYVIRAPRRDELNEWLASSKGIGCGIHYPTPVHLQSPCRHYGYAQGSLPITERYAGEILSLPMYPELESEEVEYIADAVKEFYRA